MNEANDRVDTRALGEAIAGLLAVPAQVVAGLAGSLGAARTTGCAIPPPCWEPQPAGRCTLTLAPGSSGTIRVHVTNCGWDHHLVLVTAIGKIAGWMSFTPTTLLVGPQEEGTFEVTVKVPDGVKPGDTLSGPLLVRGCRDWFVRVEVRVEECGGCAGCDVAIDDCPDQVHHWYEHFYCPRPCRTTRDRDPKNG